MRLKTGVESEKKERVHDGVGIMVRKEDQRLLLKWESNLCHKVL